MGRTTKMGFGIKKKGTSGKYEVGITNMYGMFRLEDFWSPYGGATREECEEFIKRIGRKDCHFRGYSSSSEIEGF